MILCSVHDIIVLQIVMEYCGAGSVSDIMRILDRTVRTTYVTRFGKRCIVHTSDFEYLEIYKNHNEWYTELQFLEKIEE